MTNNSSLEWIIKDNIEKLINTKNPLKLTLQIVNFQKDIKEYVNQVLEIMWNFFEWNNGKTNNKSTKSIETQIMDSLYKSNYHKSWLVYIKNYLNDSRFFKDEVFLIAYSSVNKIWKWELKSLDIKELELNDDHIDKLSFRKVRDIINIIDFNYISSREKFKLNDSIIQDIELFAEQFISNKEEVYKKLTKYIRTTTPDSKEKLILRNYFKTFLIDKHYPEVKKCLYWYTAHYFISRDDFNNLKVQWDDNIDETSKLYDFIQCKDVLIKLNNSVFSYIYKPFFYLKLSSSFKIDYKSTKWIKIKNFMFFTLSNNYDDYVNIYSFFHELEAYLKNDRFWIMKQWWFWLLSAPIILTAIFFYVPLGAFIWIVAIILNYLYKLLKELKSKTSYSINFNFWINVLASISIVWFMSSSFLINWWDVYKLWYEKTKQFVNLMSAVSPSMLFEYVDFKNDISSWYDAPKRNEVADIINHDYIWNEMSYYDKIKKDPIIEVSKIFEKNVSSDVDWKDKAEEKSEVMEPDYVKNDNFIEKDELLIDEEVEEYFFNEEEEIGNWVYLRNLAETILHRHIFEKELSLDNKQIHNIILMSIMEYTKINILQFRRWSSSVYSWQLDEYALWKQLPNWFKINMWQLEKIIVKNI